MPLNPNSSRVLQINLNTGIAQVYDFENLSDSQEGHLGGSGLAAALYRSYSCIDLPWDHPDQPVIFAIGPLTGIFPLMTKTVFGFRSPYSNQWTESHAGGNLALSLRFAGYDALVLTGKAPVLSCLEVGSRTINIHDVHYLKNADIFATGKFMRRFGKESSGHRSSLRIGPAGENGVAYACINVDSFRHFGRQGSGTALGVKNIKGMVIMGDTSLPMPEGKECPSLIKELFKSVTATDMMKKYHDLGTPENLEPLNMLKALPWQNLQKTQSEIGDISGMKIADDLLLRKSACAGCPVGCIHIALLRQQFGDSHDYLYKQVGYDYEHIFAQGTMLNLTNPQDVLAIIDETEFLGLDVMSSGVALAWITEALEKGIISTKETILNLEFGKAEGYTTALHHIAKATNEFYKALGQGVLYAANIYGGADFACVLGQEMAGYATGENFFVSQAIAFRHSHLDSGGYSYDQSSKEKDPIAAANFLMKDEKSRVGLTSCVACLFGRKVYTQEKIQECLNSIGFKDAATHFDSIISHIQADRWKLKFETGFIPENVVIPKRYTEIETWKGKIDQDYMETLKQTYISSLRHLIK